MEEEIVNRVAKSPLRILDLEAIYPKGERKTLDISTYLEAGFLLREKEFRAALSNQDWSDYQDCYVALYCSTDAVVPVWAYMLISSYLHPIARKVLVGDLAQLETLLFEESLQELDLEQFRDKPVIVKGCSQLPVPESAYVSALSRVQEIATKVMYGEACSAVPLVKRK